MKKNSEIMIKEENRVDSITITKIMETRVDMIKEVDMKKVTSMTKANDMIKEETGTINMISINRKNMTGMKITITTILRIMGRNSIKIMMSTNMINMMVIEDISTSITRRTIKKNIPQTIIKMKVSGVKKEISKNSIKILRHPSIEMTM